MHPGPSNLISSGDVLRMDQVLMSSNGKYRVRIQHCQLVMERRDEDYDVIMGIFEPHVDLVWSSDNEVPHTAVASNECFLGFEQGQLMVAGGSPEFHTGEIFWKSTIDDDENTEGGGSFVSNNYVARLENNGILVIYEVDLLWSPFDLEKDSPGRCVYATGSLGCQSLSNMLSRLVRDAGGSLSSFFCRITRTKEKPL